MVSTSLVWRLASKLGRYFPSELFSPSATAQEVANSLARLPPKDALPNVPGSRSRILMEKDGVWLWEGEPIVFDELIQ